MSSSDTSGSGERGSRDFEALRRDLVEHRARIGVIGLGYVGLPLVLVFSEQGFDCIGFDVDDAKVASLLAGESYIGHIPSSNIRELMATGRFQATSDFSRLADADAILICVPTPLAPDAEPDLSFVVATTETIARYLRPGQLIVLESTTYPGTTREVMKPILEAGGLKAGQDFLLAYSPEREDPGNAEYSTARIPKVVGGDGALACELACALYQEIVPEVIPVSSADTAEAVKLTENIFRAVNIALVNELKVIYGQMGVDIWEVIEAAKSKPFGYMPFYPGPGLGGHCIPIDPFYLAWKARQHGTQTRFIELAGEINSAMPGLVVEALEQALLERHQRPIDGAVVLLLGVAYKKNVDDIRESPALELWERLREKGARVSFHDPHVPEMPKTRAHPILAGVESVDLDAETLATFDAVLICTDHDAVDYEAVVRHAGLVIDTRNATQGRGDDAKIVKA
ncbi:MAG: nucleotide sugar dehydrogenase [Alphaproteobacteria bacterium]|jgi:UDP-N-acetyl-D-glucosamine dehydrogenase|nr:nucleotide sugar dehydrogenase [Alphaproteobacteria bacterium]